MNMQLNNLPQYLPALAFAVCGCGVIYFLYRYSRKRDLRVWTETVQAAASRAAADEAFRRTELAAAEARLAALPAPATIVPIRRRHEILLQLLPKFVFVIGSTGVAFLFLGLFHYPPGKGSDWLNGVGGALVVMAGLLLLFSEKLQRDYERVRQLNRKYLLSKAGNDFPGMFEAMEELLNYYPAVPELWLEHADRLAKASRMDDALRAVRKARELSRPGQLDLAIVELSFLVRKGDAPGAEKMLAALSDMKPEASDPRPDMYAAALALLQKDRKKAEEHARKAMELDRHFVEKFLLRDETLKDVKALLRELAI